MAAEAVRLIEDLFDIALVVDAQLVDNGLLLVRANPGIRERGAARFRRQIDIRVSLDAKPVAGFLAELREERPRSRAQLVTGSSGEACEVGRVLMISVLVTGIAARACQASARVR